MSLLNKNVANHFMSWLSPLIAEYMTSRRYRPLIIIRKISGKPSLFPFKPQKTQPDV